MFYFSDVFVRVDSFSSVEFTYCFIFCCWLTFPGIPGKLCSDTFPPSCSCGAICIRWFSAALALLGSLRCWGGEPGPPDAETVSLALCMRSAMLHWRESSPLCQRLQLLAMELLCHLLWIQLAVSKYGSWKTLSFTNFPCSEYCLKRINHTHWSVFLF